MPDSPVILHHGNCMTVLPTIPTASVDSIVTDPPYELGFMGKKWDASGIAYNVDLWRECLRVLKPGGHLLAFGGTRTYHRMAVAIEDVGFEVRDSIHWLYGSGFPKSLDVSKAIDKAAGAEREVKSWMTRERVGVMTDHERQITATSGNLQCPNCGKWKFAPDYCRCARDSGPATDAARHWQGWGTALKPAHEPIVVARKPLAGTVAANVLEHGTGALNIDGCRVGNELLQVNTCDGRGPFGESQAGNGYDSKLVTGRWPANIVFTHAADCDTECVPGCPVAALDQQSGVSKSPPIGYVANIQDHKSDRCMSGGVKKGGPTMLGYGDSGGASRFFTVTEWDDVPFRYVAKPAKKERNAGGENHHPTVKPVDLMRWLVRLVTPSGGTVLDPFAGSGTTLVAARLEGFAAIGIEMTDDYLPIIEGRVAWATKQAVQLSLFGDKGEAA